MTRWIALFTTLLILIACSSTSTPLRQYEKKELLSETYQPTGLRVTTDTAHLLNDLQLDMYISFDANISNTYRLDRIEESQVTSYVALPPWGAAFAFTANPPLLFFLIGITAVSIYPFAAFGADARKEVCPSMYDSLSSGFLGTMLFATCTRFDYRRDNTLSSSTFQESNHDSFPLSRTRILVKTKYGDVAGMTDSSGNATVNLFPVAKALFERENDTNANLQIQIVDPKRELTATIEEPYELLLAAYAHYTENAPAASTGPAVSTPIMSGVPKQPPTIALEETIHETSQATWPLKGFVFDDQEVRDVTVTANGVPLSLPRSVVVTDKPGTEADAKKTRRLDVRVPLRIGANEITIVATDNDELTAEQSLTIVRKQALGAIWAVAVGINDFQHVRHLKYARQDAEAFAAYLEQRLGVPRANVTLITDREATLRHLRKALLTDLPRMVRKDDTVMLYWAGHGVSAPDQYSPDGDGLSKYLLAADSDPDSYEATALRMGELRRAFERLPAQRVVFFGDTCFSGAAGGRTVLVARGRSATIDPNFMARLATRQGRVILSASQANQVSQESDKLQHGVFTYYLLKGLEGGADDTDGDGYISTAELLPYLQKHVEAFTDNQQDPDMKGEGTVIVGKR